ncbi:MAG: MFS transporter, partial [bacterium]|nr:MFS transporter [bacterium]
WLITYVNAPVFFIGLLVPIRESLSMLPQLFIAGYIRKLPRRKWTWIAGSVL